MFVIKGVGTCSELIVSGISVSNKKATAYGICKSTGDKIYNIPIDRKIWSRLYEHYGTYTTINNPPSLLQLSSKKVAYNPKQCSSCNQKLPETLVNYHWKQELNKIEKKLAVLRASRRPGDKELENAIRERGRILSMIL